MPQINGTSAASILGISPAQVLYLKKSGALKDLKTTPEGARHHEPAYDLDKVLKLREQYPDPAKLLQKYYRRGNGSAPDGTRGSYPGAASAVIRDQVMPALYQQGEHHAAILRMLEELSSRFQVIEQNTAAIMDHLTKNEGGK